MKRRLTTYGIVIFLVGCVLILLATTKYFSIEYTPNSAFVSLTPLWYLMGLIGFGLILWDTIKQKKKAKKKKK